MKPDLVKSTENSASPKGIVSFIFLARMVIALYFFSIAYSQWYYAGIEEGTLTSVVPKNLTSILFVSLLLLAFTLLERLSHSSVRPKSSPSTLLVIFSAVFLFSTFMSVIIGVWRSGLNFDSLEGIKSMFATLSGILLVRHFSADILFFLRLYAYLFGSIVVFSLIQVSIGINWSTKNSFFTVGAQERWWDLSSAWGPFALSGKNVFGVVLVLSFSFLAPIVLLTKVFNRFDRIFVLLILIADVYLVLLSRSRTSIVLIFVNIIVLMILYTLYSRNPIPITFSFLFIPLVGGFYFVNNTSWILSNQSSIARGNSLSAALMAPDSNFLFGTGYNSIFQLTASTFGNSLTQAGTRGINVDNYFVRRSLEGGLLGLVSFLGIIACLIYIFTIRERFGSQGRVWGISAGLLSVDITIASLSGDFLSFQLVNCFFFLILALITGALRSSET
jgi:hypothetical protein